MFAVDVILPSLFIVTTLPGMCMFEVNSALASYGGLPATNCVNVTAFTLPWIISMFALGLFVYIPKGYAPVALLNPIIAFPVGLSNPGSSVNVFCAKESGSIII